MIRLERGILAAFVLAALGMSAMTVTAFSATTPSGGWEVSIYYTPVERYHTGMPKPVTGCLAIACKRGSAVIGTYPGDFVTAVKEEGNGRITSGSHAGQYLNWSADVGYWLDSAPRDDRGGVLTPYLSAAADQSVPFSTAFRVLDCGTDLDSGDAIDANVCARLKAVTWVVRDRFSDPASGKHVDLYIGEEDIPNFYNRSPNVIDNGGAVLSMTL